MESWAIIAIVAILASFIGDIYKRMLATGPRSAAASRAELVGDPRPSRKLESDIEKRDVVQRLNALEAIVTDRSSN